MRALWVALTVTTLARAQTGPAPAGAAGPPPAPAAASAPTAAPGAAAGPAPTAAPAPAAAPAPVAPGWPGQPRVAIFTVHVAPGVHPSLGALVEQQLARSAHLLGYARVDPVTTARVAAGRSGALDPEAASGLVRAAGAALGLFARVEGMRGRYHVNVQVSHATGATRAVDASGVASDLYTSLDEAVRLLVPPASALPPPAPAPSAPAPEAAPESEALPEGRFRLALGGAAAFGVTPGPFRNFLLGARGDYRASDRVAVGVGVYYANLKAKDGRAHNVLPLALFEYRIDAGSGWAVPLRFASGHLANNGPVVKAAAGLSVPVGDDLELSAELIAPTVWIANERAVLSLDLGAEVGITF